MIVLYSVSNHHHTFTFQTSMAKRGLRIKYVYNFSLFWGEKPFWDFLFKEIWEDLTNGADVHQRDSSDQNLLSMGNTSSLWCLGTKIFACVICSGVSNLALAGGDDVDGGAGGDVMLEDSECC